jgi:ATP-binding protein involved in chromosome partitioning
LQTPFQPPQPKPIPDVKHVVAISSCKGGVGKSTLSVNLAVVLAQKGHKVGLMDADVHGPSLHKMMGVDREPAQEDGKIIPPEAHGVRFMSLGLIAGEDTPVIWRGPIVGRMLKQFLVDVRWGELDYLLLDLPPGTGDAQLTLAQSVILAGAVIVTTPQIVAQEDVVRGGEMFLKVGVPILGVIENMGAFKCDSCGHVEAIFGEGGGKAMANHFGVPMLGSIALDPEIRDSGDRGVPAVNASGPVADTINAAADQLIDRIEASDVSGPEINVV